MRSTEPYELRTLFISDLHLGSPNCQVQPLIRFLSQIRVQQLYLVGDVFDLWWITRARARFGRDEQRVIKLLDGLSRAGTEVIYIPGNHDEPIRGWCGRLLAHWKIRRRVIHQLADGRRMLVTHGDEFDAQVRLGGLKENFGERLYDLILSANRWANQLRTAAGLPYWSLAAFLKRKSHAAEAFINRFRAATLADAKHRGLDGVICGHVHRADLRMVDGLVYANDGDWVESLTALTEDHAGRLALVDCAQLPLVMRELAPHYSSEQAA